MYQVRRRPWVERSGYAGKQYDPWQGLGHDVNSRFNTIEECQDCIFNEIKERVEYAEKHPETCSNIHCGGYSYQYSVSDPGYWGYTAALYGIFEEMPGGVTRFIAGAEVRPGYCGIMDFTETYIK